MCVPTDADGGRYEVPTIVVDVAEPSPTPVVLVADSIEAQLDKRKKTRRRRANTTSAKPSVGSQDATVPSHVEQDSPAGEVFGIAEQSRTMDHLAQYLLLTREQMEMGE